MSATIMSEPEFVASSPSTSSNNKNTATSSGAEVEIELAKCECCGLTEECTPAYIERIRERYAGKWICGLCAEAVKDEIVGSDWIISSEEALARHLNVCGEFRASWPPATDPALHLIAAVRKLLRRGVRSMPVSPKRGGGSEDREMLILSRSESCFPDISS